MGDTQVPPVVYALFQHAHIGVFFNEGLACCAIQSNRNTRARIGLGIMQLIAPYRFRRQSLAGPFARRIVGHFI